MKFSLILAATLALSGCGAAGLGIATWIGAGSGLASAGLTGIQVYQTDHTTEAPDVHQH